MYIEHVDDSLTCNVDIQLLFTFKQSRHAVIMVCLLGSCSLIGRRRRRNTNTPPQKLCADSTHSDTHLKIQTNSYIVTRSFANFVPLIINSYNDFSINDFFFCSFD